MTDSPDFATKPTLSGELAVPRPFTEADLPAMRAALLDPEARILTGSVHDEAARVAATGVSAPRPSGHDSPG